jgi:hypothetical protein
MRTKREREDDVQRERQKFGTAGVIEMATNFHMVMNAALLKHGAMSSLSPSECNAGLR